MLVAGGLRFIQVSAGPESTCGVTVDSLAYCWGHNQWGNLGDGTKTNRLKPRLVAGGLRFIRVSAPAAGGGRHTCGVTTANRIYCWGNNDVGQLGDGTTTSRSTPHAVAGGLRFSDVSAGQFHTCGLTTDQRGYCWGDGDNAQLGTGTGSSLTPLPVAGGRFFLLVAAGLEHTCAVAVSHRAYCWGANISGELGDGTTEPHFTPFPVANPD